MSLEDQEIFFSRGNMISDGLPTNYEERALYAQPIYPPKEFGNWFDVTRASVLKRERKLHLHRLRLNSMQPPRCRKKI